MELQRIFLNGAYVGLLASFIVRGQLKFRVIMTVACLCFISFGWLIDNAWIRPWNVLFAGINIAQAARVVYARHANVETNLKRQERAQVRSRLSTGEQTSIASPSRAAVSVAK